VLWPFKGCGGRKQHTILVVREMEAGSGSAARTDDREANEI
jgi:hypothetical protein